MVQLTLSHVLQGHYPYKTAEGSRGPVVCMQQLDGWIR